MSSFARLFRTSKLASYDPKINQVYTTFGGFRDIGDWGLKRNLPVTLRTKFIDVQALDTLEHQTPITSAQGSILTLKRFKENFPTSKSPEALPMNIPTNVTKLSEQEWKKFIKKAANRKQEWRDAVEAKKLREDEHLSFMNAVSSRTTGSQPAYPSYHLNNPSVVKVQGRILNRITGGYAVGIAGIVAFLPSRFAAQSLGANLRDLKTFYVVKAEIDSEGKPDVVLSVTQPETASAGLNYRRMPNIFAGDKKDALSTDQLLAKVRSMIKSKPNQSGQESGSSQSDKKKFPSFATSANPPKVAPKKTEEDKIAENLLSVFSSIASKKKGN
ncbi:hypothetical protein K493DRAFT_234175 [Basidiobolus meristosporus CBS 931.73]|uniref:Uncharacterized protein n=1 Tax=Basidiobolus meristosporus CBS 931.73 TaxID=1314790 RepID=A0A1Y1XU29_9FUNG|nr:hypothetical protein K493DRAFT_234175 [Basidiobolus meristosporus CBS 931.73]|eukprot:ORX89262.1 hypothetical protein K493DRAFT_234175 [Basidiobolus meristosporus CBS 931.73]